MTNISVKANVKEAGREELQLLKDVKKRKLQYCGHIIRAGGLQSQLLLVRWTDDAAEANHERCGLMM